jgi:hypothetical protein
MLKKLLSFALILLAGCIDPINFKYEDQQEHLVVEGSFTTMANKNYIRLTYAQPYTYPYNKFETAASVYITSQEGEHFTFWYDKEGYYYPSDIDNAIGTAGHTYTLHIQAGERLYQSQPITLQQPIPIEQIGFKIDRKQFAFEGDRKGKIYNGYQILIDYNDPEQEKNYYRWSFASQYEVLTQPGDFVDNEGNPAPKDCCARCWLDEKREAFIVADDRLTNGKKVLNHQVLFMPFERYLQSKHKLRVYQHAITAEAYEFYRVMGQQKESTGTVFDPPPSEIKGNMFRVGDEKEQVLGFFEVSGVAVRQVVIVPENIPFDVGAFAYPDDCRVMRGATNQRPEGWDE